MAIIDEVKAVCDRLAPLGWMAIFKAHKLDITVPLANLAAELAKTLVADRTQPGFEEFSPDGTRGVEPGSPGRSLFYHGLASPDVKAAGFPTLDELDTVENYIYAAAKRTLADFSNPVIGVFAYQYREMSLSPHRKHADIAFSRCGVARVGSEAERYDPAARSFDPRPAGGDRGFAVLPARYGVFIAEYRAPGSQDQVLRRVASDATQTFLFPVHKLFAGKECLYEADRVTPLTLPALKFSEYHLDEKLKRLHTPGPDNPGFVKPLTIFNLNQPPFFRDSTNSKLVTLRSQGASVLVVPVAGPIVRTATQKVAGISQLARFAVPKQNSQNRFLSSLQISSTGNGRAAPEYANIRQEVVPTASGGFRVVDLNQTRQAGTPTAKQFDKKLATGNFEAAHFIDGTCDGFISVPVPPALSGLQVFPAYSLVAAIDFFPQVEQVEISEWVEKNYRSADRSWKRKCRL